MLVLSACENVSHAVCTTCVRSMYAGDDVYETVLKDFSNGKLCPHCDAVTMFKEKWLQYILTSMEYTIFSQRLRRVLNPTSMFIPCKNITPIEVPVACKTSKSQTKTTQWVTCPFDIEVNKRVWTSHKKGSLILQCTSGFCLHRRCADCSWCVPKSSSVCPRCWGKDTSATTMLWSPTQQRGLYVSELDTVTVLHHLCDIVCDDGGRLSCPGCGVKITKTVNCNSISHCGYHFCYVCRAVTSDPFLPLTHWDPHGKCGCPRWDTDPYWNDTAGCNFKCTDACRSHDSSCTHPEHAAGVEAMTQERKRWAIWTLLKSIGSDSLKRLRIKVEVPQHPHLVDLKELKTRLREMVQMNCIQVHL